MDSASVHLHTRPTMTLLVDYRERRLAEVLEIAYLVSNLAVGDLLCDYGGGNRWIAERKTASDLAQYQVVGGINCTAFVKQVAASFS